MAGKAYDTKNDFERCAALRDWRLTHAGDLPNRHWRLPTRSDSSVEKALASWLSKALQRRQRALSDRPSERQLTPDETVHLDSIVGMAIGQASANAPASASSDPAAEIPVAVPALVSTSDGTATAAVSNKPLQRHQAEPVPEAPSKRLRTTSSKADTLCMRGLNIQWPFSQLILMGAKARGGSSI